MTVTHILIYIILLKFSLFSEVNAKPSEIVILSKKNIAKLIVTVKNENITSDILDITLNSLPIKKNVLMQGDEIMSFQLLVEKNTKYISTNNLCIFFKKNKIHKCNKVNIIFE
ncbi:hypothetical protein C9J12_28000 [Photobacterium frigidiphilum]|uniref:Uncharacterized protein n=1 Tax=Photobacterium frigidiphilum TaxID=264736 RepID=A0A2T3J6H0_9GAMM|nr:hypothetical protein [Photobacterium frigidiphilum]PSU43625.1 hypothetical protein C9J12_28000 [Photobacterium frigidiphilum]